MSTMTTEKLTPYAINEIAELARQGVLAETLDFDTTYLITDSNGNQHVHVTDSDPAERSFFERNNLHGRRDFHDPASLLAYVQRHSIDDTEIWADLKASRLTAVLDAPGPGKQRPAAHRAALSLVKTADWADWMNLDRTWVEQATLAQFIEDHFGNFANPNAVDMLEIAQRFEMTKSVKYKTAKRIATGETQLVYEESAESKGGGQYKIPEILKLNIQVFEHTPAQEVQARLHYRITRDNDLQMKILLERPCDVEKAQFEKLATVVKTKAEKLDPTPHWYFGEARPSVTPVHIY